MIQFSAQHRVMTGFWVKVHVSDPPHTHTHKHTLIVSSAELCITHHIASNNSIP